MSLTNLPLYALIPNMKTPLDYLFPDFKEITKNSKNKENKTNAEEVTTTKVEEENTTKEEKTTTTLENKKTTEEITTTKANIEKLTIEEYETIPYHVIYKTSYDLAPGQWRIINYGIEGQKTSYYEVTYKDGLEVSREYIFSDVTKVPVDEVVEIGPEGTDTSETTEPVNIDTTMETLPDTSPVTETPITSVEP